MTGAHDTGQALAEIVGAAHTLGGDAARTITVDGVAPSWLVLPGSVEEVSRVLALAAVADLGVAPVGTGAALGLGGIPRRLDVVLSLRRLERILAHEPADLTLSVEAGATIGALNAALLPYRQFLPLDPARGAGATVGGLIATGQNGPYRARYGTMRDLLLGLTVVQADGTVVKGGGRVVKNVTGYDMPKLHVGALGTLGVVVEAHLRLHPVPAEERTWVLGFPTAEAALDAAVAVRDAPVIPSRLQLIGATALAALGAPPARAALGVAIGSVPDAVRAQGGRVEEICRLRGGTALDVGSVAGWWERVAAVATPAGSPDGLTLRIGARPGDVVKVLRAVEAAAAAVSATAVATAEVANGVLHAYLAGAAVAEAPGLVGRIRDDLAPLDGTCVVEHAPASVKVALDVWGDVGPALAPMRRLKAELDPRGILNGGRFVGGI